MILHKKITVAECFPVQMTDWKAAAFFDFDLTITNRDSFRTFLYWYYTNNIFRLIYMPYIFCMGIFRKFRVISLKTFKEHALIGLKSKTHDELFRIGELFFNERLCELITEPSIEQVRLHKEKGESVFIVSASPDIYINAVVNYYGFDGYICTELAYHNNQFTGYIKGNDCIGSIKKEKVNKLAEMLFINLKRSTVYSDHEADLPFLEMAGKAVAVSPTPMLKKVAENRKYKIIKWR